MSRLTASLGGLEEAIVALERSVAQEARRGDMAAELALMRLDRQRLADDLEAALRRAQSLDRARKLAEERIEKATGAIRAVLAGSREVEGR
jgi:autotransporter translocation and assembly factor TamB